MGDQMQPHESQKPSPGANFLIQVQYRHNSSWQGRIVWLDTKKSMVFLQFYGTGHVNAGSSGTKAASIS